MKSTLRSRVKKARVKKAPAKQEREKKQRTERIDQVKSAANQYAVYFHCQTDLVSTFRELYPELNYDGNRSILLDAADALPEAALRHCVALALTYHLNKRKGARAG